MPTLDEMTKTRKVPNSLEQMSQSSPAPRSIYDNIKDPNEAAKLAEEVVDLSHKFGLPPGVVEDDYPLLSSFPDPQDFGTSRTKMVVPPPRTFTIDGKTYTYGPQAEHKRPHWDELVDAVAVGSASFASSAATKVSRFWEYEPPLMPGPYVQPTKEGRKAHREIAKRWEEHADFMWKLSQDPALAMQNKDTATKFLRLVGETIPYITGTTVAATILGPGGGFMVGWMVEGNSAYRTALDNGVPEAQARMIGAGVGIISGAIESFGGAVLSKKATEAITKYFTSRGAEIIVGFSVDTLVEAIEEGGQEIAAIIGEKTYREVDWNEAISRTLSSMAGGAALGGAFGATRTAGQRAFTTKAERQQISEARQERARMVGLRRDVERIKAIPDITEEEKQEWIKSRIAKEGLQLVEEEKAEGEGEEKPVEKPAEEEAPTVPEDLAKPAPEGGVSEAEELRNKRWNLPKDTKNIKVFHGTREKGKKKFRDFTTDAGLEVGAGYFAVDETIAEGRLEALREMDNVSGVVLPFEIDVKNPIGMVDVGKFSPNNVIDGILDYNNAEELAEYGIKKEEMLEIKKLKENMPYLITKKEVALIKYLESKGIDGLAFENIDELTDAQTLLGKDAESATTFVPFRKEQIKQAPAPEGGVRDEMKAFFTDLYKNKYKITPPKITKGKDGIWIRSPDTPTKGGIFIEAEDWQNNKQFYETYLEDVDERVIKAQPPAPEGGVAEEKAEPAMREDKLHRAQKIAGQPPAVEARLAALAEDEEGRKLREDLGIKEPPPPPPQPPSSTPVAPDEQPGGPKVVKPPGRARRFMLSLYQKVFNRYASLEWVAKQARRTGLEVKPGKDPGMVARLHSGVVRKARTFLEDATFRTTPEGKIEMTGEGLQPILEDHFSIFEGEPTKELEEDLQTYETATRIVRDLQRPAYEGGESIATPEQTLKAEKDLDELQDKYGDEGFLELQRIGNRLVGFRQRLLHLLVDGGLLSEQQYEAILEKNPHYAPFNRILDDLGEAAPVTKQGKKAPPSPVKRIKGSKLEIENTIESTIKAAYRIMDVVERNNVRRGIVDLISAMPEGIIPVHRRVYPIRVSPGEVKTTRETIHRKSQQILEEVTEEGISQESADSPAAVGPIKKLEAVIKESLTKRGMSEGEARNAVEILKKQGTKRAQAETREVRTVEKTIKELTKDVVTTLEKPTESIIFRPSPFIPKGNIVEYWDNGNKYLVETTPEIFDTLTGMTEESLGIITKVLAVPAHTLRVGATITPEFMVRNPIRDQWTALMQTSVGFKPFIDTGAAVADIMKKSDVYLDWIRSGGALSGFVELSRPELAKAYKDLQGRKSLLQKLNIIRDAQDLSILLEQATRLGAYKAAIREGKTPMEAAYVSREATVDFARRGSKMRNINSVIAFFNAGIQGLDKSVRTAKNDPVGMAIKGVATITIPSLILYLRNRDDPEYWEFLQWQRDLFWMLKVNDTWIRVPKPFLYGQIFGSAMERFFRYADTKDPESFRGLAKSLYESASPVAGEGIDALLPTAVKPLFENERNWNYFRETPLFPKDKEQLLPQEQYGKYTSETAKLLGKWIEMSPAKMENLIRGYFGGTGMYALRGSDKIIRQIQAADGVPIPERPSELGDAPLLRGFFPRDPIGSQAESIRRFYDETTKIKTQAATVRRLNKEGNRTEANKIIGKYPGLILAPTLTTAADEFNKLSKEADEIALSMDLEDKEKKEQIREIYSGIIERAKELNQMVRNVNKDGLDALSKEQLEKVVQRGLRQLDEMTNKELRAYHDASTLKYPTKRTDGKWYRRGAAKIGLEKEVEQIKEELAQRGLRH